MGRRNHSVIVRTIRLLFSAYFVAIRQLFLRKLHLAANYFLQNEELCVFLQIEKQHQSMISTNTIPTANIADIYMSVLASLSVKDRLDLIAKLSSSIKNTPQATSITIGDLRTMFCGEWGDTGELRDSEYTGREVLNW